MQILEEVEEDEIIWPTRVSLRRNGSLSCLHPSVVIDSLSRKSFSYNKLPQKPLNLIVVKLDGSSFGIEVARMGTVAQLKEGVEAAFSHLPKNGPGMVSWSHVWGNFCLCYNGEKLLTDSDHIGRYGIQDGEKLCFVRHVSVSYNMVKQRAEKDPDLYELNISDGCKDRQKIGEKDNIHHERDIANQQDDYDYDDSQGVSTRCQYNLAQLFRGWFSYQKLVSIHMRMEEKSTSSRLSFSILGGFKNFRQLSSNKLKGRLGKQSYRQAY